MNDYSYNTYLLVEELFWFHIENSVCINTRNIFNESVRHHIVDSVSISVRVAISNYVYQALNEMNDYE